MNCGRKTRTSKQRASAYLLSVAAASESAALSSLFSSACVVSALLSASLLPYSLAPKMAEPMRSSVLMSRHCLLHEGASSVFFAELEEHGRLGEQVRLLLRCEDPLQLHQLPLDRVVDEVILDVDVLGALALDSVLADRDGRLIVSVHRRRALRAEAKLREHAPNPQHLLHGRRFRVQLRLAGRQRHHFASNVARRSRDTW